MQEKIRKTVFQHQSSGNCYLDFSALALLTLFWPRLLWRVIIYCGSLVTVHEETTGCWLTVPLVLKSENFAQLSISTCPWHRCVSTEDLFSTAALPGFFSHWCSWPLPSHPPLHLTRSLYWLNAQLHLSSHPKTERKFEMHFFPQGGSPLHCVLLNHPCQKLFICVPEKSSFPDQKICCLGLVRSKLT